MQNFSKFPKVFLIGTIVSLVVIYSGSAYKTTRVAADNSIELTLLAEFENF